MKDSAEKAVKQAQETVNWRGFKNQLQEQYGLESGEIDWSKLGELALTMIGRTPTTQFLFGPLDAGPAPKKPSKQRQQKEKEMPMTQSQVTNLAENPNENDRPDNTHEA